MLATVAHLGALHTNANYGLDQSAAIWMTVVAVLLYAGPAVVGMIYLMIRDKNMGNPVGLSPWSPSSLPKLSKSQKPPGPKPKDDEREEKKAS
jgi:hypothetical protein